MYLNKPLQEYLDDLASSKSTPGGVSAAAQLDEVPQCPGVGGEEDFGLGGVGQDAAGRLAGGLAAGRSVRLVRHFGRQLLGKLEVRPVAVADGVEPDAVPERLRIGMEMRS